MEPRYGATQNVKHWPSGNKDINRIKEMGSWNKTCGISQLPIEGDSQVVSILLVGNEFTNRRATRPCYSTRMGWNWIPLPFKGLYDTYGTMEDHSGQQNRYDFLKKEFAGRISYIHKTKISPEITDAFRDNQWLNDALQSDNISLSINGSDDPRPLANFMVLSEIWDEITNGVFRDYPKPKFFNKSELVETAQAAYASLVAQRDELLKIRLEALSKRDVSEEERERLTAAIKNTVDRYISVDYEELGLANTLYDDPRRTVASFLTSGDRHNLGLEFPIITAIDAGAITMEEVVECCLFIESISSLRKQLVPQAGEGSQENIGELHVRLARVTSKIINQYFEDED